MQLVQLTLLYCMLTFSFPAGAPEYLRSSPTTAHNTKKKINTILQSKDGGQTWQDIGVGLPENEQLEDFFAGEKDVYVRFESAMYRRNNNLKTPAWEKENAIDSRCTSVAFNRSSVTAFNNEGLILQTSPSAPAWIPAYTNLKKQSVRNIFESSDGTIFLACGNGLYKSSDKGRNWKHVLNEGWVMELVESEGVLIGTGEKGIMRSTDNGERWEWVISEGGVGIDVERIDGGFAALSYQGSTISRRIRISLDGGKTWKAIDAGLEPSLTISSIKQMGKYLICGHPDGIFRSSDLGKTWQIVRTGHEGKVFKIHASGDVLYAVAGDPGC